MGLQTLEGMIDTGMTSITGDPMFTGLLLLGFFAGIVFIMPTRGDVKIMVLVPAAILAAAFFPVMGIIVVLVVTALLTFAALKMLNR